MPAGRPPARIADHLAGIAGPDDARERVRVVLEALAGETTVADACARLGVGESRFHELRRQVLEGAVAHVTTGSPGRPARHKDPASARERELLDRIAELELVAEAARVRTELALTMPQILKRPWLALKKKR